MERMLFKQVLPVETDVCWHFFSDPGNLQKITPPDMNFRILSGAESKMYAGQVIIYKIQLFPLISIKWVTEITQVSEGDFFIDEQRFGPYKFWHHQHKFREIEGGTEIVDEIHYKLPFGILGTLINRLFVRKKLQRIFLFRKNILSEINFN